MTEQRRRGGVILRIFIVLSFSDLRTHGELHDGVDDVAVGLLEGRDGLSARGARDLLEDEVNVLGVDAGLVDGAVVLLGGDERGDVVAASSSALLRSGDLRLEGLELGRLVVLLDLGLTEEDEGVLVGSGLEDVGGIHDEVDLLALANDSTSNAGNLKIDVRGGHGGEKGEEKGPA